MSAKNLRKAEVEYLPLARNLSEIQLKKLDVNMDAMYGRADRKPFY